ncbi:MAG: Mov34/MPN/PAD-1 family protein [Fuerstiella sp.]
MSEIDVSQLAKESLSTGTFPASHAADFRVHFEESVHSAIMSHASEDTSIEICGVVVGEWLRDNDGPFARITNFIRCDDAASKNTEVTFTHQSWSQINEEMDSTYSDKRILGWYHSHPDFGIFLSDRDMFIQEHFFCGAGQFAYVVDPVRKLEGVFEWRGGKAELMRHYWAGNRIIHVAAATSVRPAAATRSETVAAARSAETSPQLSVEPPLSMASLLLAAASLFLLGILLGHWRNGNEQQYLAEGAVAHYGLWNVLQLGRSEQVEAVYKKVAGTFDAVSTLAEEQTGKFEGDERRAVRKKFQDIRKQLAAARDDLQLIQSRYSVPPEQRELLAQVVVAHIGALSGIDTRRTLPVPIPIPMPTQEEDTAKKRDDGNPSKFLETQPKSQPLSPAPSAKPRNDSTTGQVKQPTTPSPPAGAQEQRTPAVKPAVDLSAAPAAPAT